MIFLKKLDEWGRDMCPLNDSINTFCQKMDGSLDNDNWRRIVGQTRAIFFLMKLFIKLPIPVRLNIGSLYFRKFTNKSKTPYIALLVLQLGITGLIILQISPNDTNTTNGLWVL